MVPGEVLLAVAGDVAEHDPSSLLAVMLLLVEGTALAGALGFQELKDAIHAADAVEARRGGDEDPPGFIDLEQGLVEQVP